MNTDFYFLAQADGNVVEQPVVSESVDAVEEITMENGSTVVDPNAVGVKKQQGPFSGQMIFLVLMIVVIYFFLFRGPRQKQKKQQQMMNELSKNDKVRTIGGIIGTIVDIRDNEIVLKIDETNNTKIKILKGAIATKIKDEVENA